MYSFINNNSSAPQTKPKPVIAALKTAELAAKKVLSIFTKNVGAGRKGKAHQRKGSKKG